MFKSLNKLVARGIRSRRLFKGIGDRNLRKCAVISHLFNCDIRWKSKYRPVKNRDANDYQRK